MLSPRDKKILKWIEDYGSITIYQASLVFFPHNQFAYDYARIRLKRLRDISLLKVYTNKITDEYIYYTDKKMSYHDNCSLNALAQLIYNGAEIVHFERPAYFMNKLMAADALIGYKYQGETYGLFVEVDISHKSDIKRYVELYDSGEVQATMGGFPLVLILTDSPKKYNLKFKVISTDIKSKDFRDKVLV